jgi:hypothetical protein
LKAKDGSVIFSSSGKLSAVASVGRDRENLEAEAALGARRGIPAIMIPSRE